MTERVMIYHQFDGVTLHNDTSIRQVEPLEYSGDLAITRIFRLANGTKFDADGDDDGSTVPGNIRATYRVTGSTHAAALALALTLEGCLNKKGQLYGREFGASSWVGKWCVARCMIARPIARTKLAMAAGKVYQIEVEMVWERFTNWA